MPSDVPFVSVIIPVYNDAARLALCLDALAQQTYPRYEVIVVDNGSDQPELIGAVSDRYDFVVSTSESTPGSYAARNRGCAIAQGEIFAFTDADCIPAADWIEEGVRCLKQIPNCGLIAGRIDLFPVNPDRPTSVELFEMATAFPQEHHVNTLKYGATANLFTTAAVVARVGLFNAELKSGGDLDWGRRVHSAGYPQVYADSVQIKHPARSSFQQMRQKTIRLAGGHYDLLRRDLYHFFYENSLPYAVTQLSLPPSVLRQLMFLFILAQDLIPPVMFMITATRSQRLRTRSQRLRVALVVTFVRYTSAWAKIRLLTGLHPART